MERKTCPDQHCSLQSTFGTICVLSRVGIFYQGYVMKQAVAGVRPAGVEEAHIMTVYPSVSATWLGRALGRLFAIRAPDIYIFRLGNLIALASIPIALVLYFGRLAPTLYRLTPSGCCYRVTNRRVVALRTEILHDQSRYKIGLAVGLSAGVFGFVMARFILMWAFPGMSWFMLLILCIVSAAIGFAKGFVIACWRFEFFRETGNVPLDGFDSIEVDVRPGQSWHHAGDLVFRSGATERFRLEGVSRPEAFRQVCLKAHFAYQGVQAAT